MTQQTFRTPAGPTEDQTQEQEQAADVPAQASPKSNQIKEVEVAEPVGLRNNEPVQPRFSAVLGCPPCMLRAQCTEVQEH